MLSWSGGECLLDSSLWASLGPRLCIPRDFNSSFLSFYQAATKFHKSPVLNGDGEVHLPHRVPACVKTGGRNPGECPLNRNLQVGADFCEEAVGLSAPLSCCTRVMLFERTEPGGEKRGGWRYLKAVRGVNWGM